jgi:hypothetical protein
MSDASPLQQFASLTEDVAAWLQNCTPTTRQRRLNVLVEALIPDICLYCGHLQDAHELGTFCPDKGCTTRFTKLRPKVRS